jgi:hypothetical protein
MGLSFGADFAGYLLAGSAYQAMDLSRLKRMARPRAAARRMAQASVERWRGERVLGVDMISLLKEGAMHTKKCAVRRLIFEEGV